MDSGAEGSNSSCYANGMLGEQRDSSDAGRHSAQRVDRQFPQEGTPGRTPYPLLHPPDAAFPFPERDEDAELC